MTTITRGQQAMEEMVKVCNKRMQGMEETVKVCNKRMQDGESM